MLWLNRHNSGEEGKRFNNNTLIYSICCISGYSIILWWFLLATEYEHFPEFAVHRWRIVRVRRSCNSRKISGSFGGIWVEHARGRTWQYVMWFWKKCFSLQSSTRPVARSELSRDFFTWAHSDILWIVCMGAGRKQKFHKMSRAAFLWFVIHQKISGKFPDSNACLMTASVIHYTDWIWPSSKIQAWKYILDRDFTIVRVERHFLQAWKSENYSIPSIRHVAFGLC